MSDHIFSGVVEPIWCSDFIFDEEAFHYPFSKELRFPWDSVELVALCWDFSFVHFDSYWALELLNPRRTFWFPQFSFNRRFEQEVINRFLHQPLPDQIPRSKTFDLNYSSYITHPEPMIGQEIYTLEKKKWWYWNFELVYSTDLKNG